MPRRAITRISTSCSWVNIGGLKKAAILAQVGQFYFGDGVSITSAVTVDGSKKLADGEGLHLLLKENGSRLWRMKFRLFGKELTYSIGPYPTVSIEQARVAAREARKLIRKGLNPIETQREKRTEAYVASVTTFGKVAREFLDLKLDGKAEATQDKLEWQYRNLAPLHAAPIASITAPKVIELLRSIEARGHRESAQRVAQFANRVFRYAVQHGHCAVNPVADLREVLKPKQVKSHAGITDPKSFGQLMRYIDTGAIGRDPNVIHGLQLLARTFVRPGEMRLALWNEFDFQKAEWRIPAERMKMRRPHLVPLSRQVIAILREHQKVTGREPLVFPGLRSGRPMSDAAINVALRGSFYDKAEHVSHGFRVSASTLLNEAGVDPALIELQLSHAKQDKIAGIYDRSQRVPERKELMQRWADMIDEFKALWD